MSATPTERDLQLRARARISEGRLPCPHQFRTWGGRGSNRPCALCDTAIRPDEVEYEIEAPEDDGARLFHFHILCHNAWQYECAQSSLNPNPLPA
ncbi:MAG TPA: hypothetical protein VGF89_06585 [Steroidobacteraceae bacterium]|jgi:hypothetical protein